VTEPSSREACQATGDPVRGSGPEGEVFLRKKIILLIACIGTSMSPYDGGAVSVALPMIGEDLNAGLSALFWIPMATLVPSAVLQILFGRLADLRGRKNLYSAGVGLFTLTSLLSGLSRSLPQLITFRIFQGIAGALLWSNSAAIATESFPERERGKAMGFYVMSVYLGLAIGPVLGGFLTQHGGWRSIFLLNVVVGAITFYLSRTFLPDEPVKRQRISFDWVGALLFAVFLISLLLALTFVQIAGWLSPWVILLLILSILALSTFIPFESRTSGEPMLDVSLFTQNRLFRAANTAAMMNYMAIFGAPYLLSLYLQGVLHYNPSRVGLLLIPQPVMMTILSPLAGRLSDRIGSRALTSAGMGFIAISLILLSRLGLESSAIEILADMALMGIGMGLFSSPNNSAIMGSVGRGHLGVASGTVGTVRIVGMSLGLALISTIMASALPQGGFINLLVNRKSPITLVAREGMIQGLRQAFLFCAVIAVVGLFASLVRGRPVLLNSRNRRQGD